MELNGLHKEAVTPSYKKLMEKSVEHCQLNIETATVKVFENGYVAFEDTMGNKRYRTVFHLTQIKWYCESVVKTDSADLTYFLDNLPADQAISLFGYARLQHNADRRQESYVAIHMDNEGNDWDPACSTSSGCVEDEVMGRLMLPLKHQQVDRLKKALKKLSAKQQQAVYLFYFEGLTKVQISKYLGISNSSVHNRLDGALKKLKKFF